MVAKKKKEEKNDNQEGQEAQSYQDRAMQRLEESGDTRVPSDPEHFRPADIPPEPLTPHESSSTAPQEA
jgi:hypothetical protein